MSGVWTKDRNVWTPSSGAEADSRPRGGSPEKAELGLLEEWEEGPLGSWLIASPPLPAMEMVFQQNKAWEAKQSYSAE